jgi:hypothetical protein
VNIINVAVGGNFYQGPIGDIEEELSSREARYADALERLRKRVADKTTPTLIAEFVFNLMIRTKNFRDGLTVLGNRALDLVETPRFEDAMRRQVLKDFLEKPEVKASLISVPKCRRKRILSVMLMKAGIDLTREFRHFWAAAETQVNVGQIVRTAQLNQLEQDGLPEPRKESFLTYHWHIDNKPSGTYLLGDVGPIARVQDSKELKLPYGFGTPTVVYLPISSRELLIGATSEEGENVDSEEVNLASVELSRDFFISSRLTQTETVYLQHIGRREFTKDPEIARGFEEVFQEFEND